MDRVFRACLLVAAVSAASAVISSNASAQVGGQMPIGGLSMTPVVSEPTAAAPSTDSFFSQFFAFRSFRGWGTSVVARPAYRSPALVLRERVGMSKTR
jgi:hypothetical protein